MNSVYFQNAINACLAAGNGTIYIPSGEYYLAGGLVVDRVPGSNEFDSVLFSAYGATLTLQGTADEPILSVIPAVNEDYVSNVIIQGGAYRYATKDWTSTGRSVIRMLGTKYCGVRDATLYGGYTAVELDSQAESGGCVYNHFSNNAIINCLKGYRLEPSGTGGWVNENTFMGGRIHYRSGLTGADLDSLSETHAIILRNGAQHVINNNRFYNIAIESASGADLPRAAFVSGMYNGFYHLRYENLASPYFEFADTLTDRNIISMGRGLENSSDVFADDVTKTAAYLQAHKELSLWGGGLGLPAFSVANRHGNTSPAINVYSPASSKKYPNLSILSGGSILLYPDNPTATSEPQVELSNKGVFFYPADADTLTPANIEVRGDGVLRFEERSEPTVQAGTKGSVYFDSSDDALKLYNGSSWQRLVNTSNGSGIRFVPMTPPTSNLEAGLVYFDSRKNELRVWNGSEWRVIETTSP